MAKCCGTVLIGLLLGALPVGATSAAESQWVRTGVTGRLIYVPDAEGDRVMDFSGVGYRGQGTKLLPNDVPNVITISPVAGDDTAQIQSAIDYVSSLPLGLDGFRGAVLLDAGDYDVGTQLTIAASGVVLRGVGREMNDTVLHGRGTGQRPLVQVLGSGSQAFTGNPKRNMIDNVVPVGATSFRVDSVSGLNVGDTVRIDRPSTAEWIAAVGMDNPPDGDPPWEPGTMNIRFDRVITRIEGNRVFLDAPLANSFEQQYGGGTIQRYSWNGRIENVGIENLRAESDFVSATDEDHAWEFVSIGNAQHVWVQHTTSRYFGDSAVVSNPTAKWVTVDDAINLDPVSIVTGERRYTFDLSGQLDMVANSQANSGRHDFVNNSTRPPGPHVFYNSVSNNALNDSGPHQRWATGTLFDNITVNGNNIDARNRGSLGTTHGWSGANIVVWNSTADGFIIQNPPTAQNWLIGSTGAIIDDMEFGPQPPGYVDSHGTPVTVGGTNSLYEAQMNDAADVREFHSLGGNGNWNDAAQWDQKIAPGVYEVSSRDYLIGDIDSFANDGASSVDNAYVDPAWGAQVSNSSGLPITGFDDLAGNQNVAFTIQHQLDAGERVVHGYLALGLRQAGGGDADADFLRLFDLAPEHRFEFAELDWNAALNPNDTLVGVVDMGGLLDQMQSGSVNVQLGSHTGVDWASYVVTVATPLDDSLGPNVWLDGGGTTTVDSAVAPVAALQLGGDAASTLRLESNGAIEVRDAYNQLANGTLTWEIGANTLGGYVLQVDGTASLAGHLEIALADGFVPGFDEEFRLLSAAEGVTGQYSDVAMPSLSAGQVWQVSYGLTSVTLRVVLAGDYNGNGIVDAADYTVWRDSLGQVGMDLAADGTGPGGMPDGIVDSLDYYLWKSHFGQSAGSGSGSGANAAVPEPATPALFMFAAAGWYFRRRRAE